MCSPRRAHRVFLGRRRRLREARDLTRCAHAPALHPKISLRSRLHSFLLARSPGGHQARRPPASEMRRADSEPERFTRRAWVGVQAWEPSTEGAVRQFGGTTPAEPKLLQRARCGARHPNASALRTWGALRSRGGNGLAGAEGAVQGSRERAKRSAAPRARVMRRRDQGSPEAEQRTARATRTRAGHPSKKQAFVSPPETPSIWSVHTSPSSQSLSSSQLGKHTGLPTLTH